MTTETYSEIGQNRPSIPKDPEAVLDYTFDWTDWLAGISDTISTKTIVGTGVTIDSSVQVGALVSVWVSGGTAGEVATVECKIVTTGGRTDERKIYLIVEER
jgi:hypothetical protein